MGLRELWDAWDERERIEEAHEKRGRAMGLKVRTIKEGEITALCSICETDLDKDGMVLLHPGEAVDMVAYCKDCLTSVDPEFVKTNGVSFFEAFLLILESQGLKPRMNTESK